MVRLAAEAKLREGGKSARAVPRDVFSLVAWTGMSSCCSDICIVLVVGKDIQLRLLLRKVGTPKPVILLLL